jgi:hypothetical protein
MILAVAHVEPGRRQPVAGVAGEADADDGVQRSVGDGRGEAGAVGEGEVETLDARNEAREGEDRRRSRAARAERERVAHHGALRETAEHGPVPAKAMLREDRLEMRCELLERREERVSIG